MPISFIKRIMPVFIKTRLKALMARQQEISRVSIEMSTVDWANYTHVDVAFSQALLTSDNKAPIKEILWLIPHFLHPFGGIFTILRFGNHLKSLNYNVRFVIYDNPDFVVSDKTFDMINKYIPGLDSTDFLTVKSLDDIPASDMAIATFWASAYVLLKLRNTRHKIYFIQDYEPQFYEAGTFYHLAEDTYAFPFHRIVNTKGLFDYVTREHPVQGVKSMYFTPGIDDRYRYKEKDLTGIVKLFFYARPNANRNAFGTGLNVLKALHNKYGGRIQIIFAGEDLTPFEAIIRSHVPNAVLRGNVSYDDLAEFYSDCHFGLVFMFTKHPSYIPLELMKSGCLVITNYNKSNLWLYNSDQNCILIDSSIDGCIRKIDAVMASPAQYKKIIKQAHDTVADFKWAHGCKEIQQFVDSLQSVN